MVRKKKSKYNKLLAPKVVQDIWNMSKEECVILRTKRDSI